MKDKDPSRVAFTSWEVGR